MATIQPVTNKRDASTDDAVILATWANLTTGDVGGAFGFAAWSDRTFQVFGTFGGATVTVEGSCDGVNWAQISNRQGTLMSFTAAGLNTTQDRPVFVRPVVSGGTGVTLTIVLTAHRVDLAGNAP